MWLKKKDMDAWWGYRTQKKVVNSGAAYAAVRSLHRMAPVPFTECLKKTGCTSAACMSMTVWARGDAFKNKSRVAMRWPSLVHYQRGRAWLVWLLCGMKRVQCDLMLISFGAAPLILHPARSLYLFLFLVIAGLMADWWMNVIWCNKRATDDHAWTS